MKQVFFNENGTLNVSQSAKVTSLIQAQLSITI